MKKTLSNIKHIFLQYDCFYMCSSTSVYDDCSLSYGDLDKRVIIESRCKIYGCKFFKFTTSPKAHYMEKIFRENPTIVIIKEIFTEGIII